MSVDRDPVVIIGAPRSGTNMLRDLLVQLPGLVTWPCDEIDPIWRHGNLAVPHDEFGPEAARPEVVRFIRRAFDRIGSGSARVIEKTCANSLRVQFVRSVLPEAKFIFLVRDGRDAAASAMTRWRAPADLTYTLRKARFVPPTDLPFYVTRWIRNRLSRLSSADRHLATWGPRFRGMDDCLSERGLAATCARQWSTCVEFAARDFARIESDRWIVVRYGSFVRRPRQDMERILRFLGVDPAVGMPDLSGVKASRVGHGWARLDDATRASMEPELAPGLAVLESL